MANIFDLPLSDGWVVFDESLAAKKLHVSNSGDDGNNGTISAPFSSIAKALQSINDGEFSIICLERGDSWNIENLVLNKSGESYDRPVVIQSYGAGDKPRLSFSGTGF